MSEMVKRVAKEVERKCKETAGRSDDYCKWPTMQDAVRFAIEAIREPTDEMVEAGMSNMLFFGPGREKRENYTDLAAAFTGMIDAILKD